MKRLIFSLLVMALDLYEFGLIAYWKLGSTGLTRMNSAVLHFNLLSVLVVTIFQLSILFKERLDETLQRL